MNDVQLIEKLHKLQTQREELQKKMQAKLPAKSRPFLVAFLSMFVVLALLVGLGLEGVFPIIVGFFVFIAVLIANIKGEVDDFIEVNAISNVDSEISFLLKHKSSISNSRLITSTSTPKPKPKLELNIKNNLEGDESIQHAPKLAFVLILVDAIFQKYKRVSPKPYSLKIKSLKKKLLNAESHVFTSLSEVQELHKEAIDIRNDFDPFDDVWLWEKLQLIVDLLDEISNQDLVMSSNALAIIANLDTPKK